MASAPFSEALKTKMSAPPFRASFPASPWSVSSLQPPYQDVVAPVAAQFSIDFAANQDAVSVRNLLVVAGEALDRVAAIAAVQMLASELLSRSS